MDPTVAGKVGRYLDRIDATAPGLIQGFYLLGSVALGDYQPGRSDVDFVAVTAEPPSSTALDILESVHRGLDSVPALDGFYIASNQLEAPPKVLPFELAGGFHRQSNCFEINPVTWTIWRDFGVTAHGVQPADLGLTIDPDELMRFERDNLDGYWADWITAQRNGPVDVEWGVLGLLRLAHVLATGRVVSKSSAGLWALGRFDPSWHLVIQAALALRRGDILSLSPALTHAALEFMAEILAETRSWHPLR